MRTLLGTPRGCIFTILLLCGVIHPAHGKKGPASPGRADNGNRQTADERSAQLLTQASTEVDKREFATAYKTIANALKAAPSAEGLYLLCRLAIAEGKDVAVRDLCRRYLADAGHAEKPAIPHQNELTEVLAKQIPPSGEVAVFGSPGALLYLDDRLVGTLPLARPLLASAGQHRVSLQESDHRQEWPVKVLADRTVEMRFEPESSAVLVTQLPAVLLLFRTDRLPKSVGAKAQQAIEQAVQSAHFATIRESGGTGKATDDGQCLSQPECVQGLASQNNADYVLAVDASEVREDSSHKLAAQLALSFSETRTRTKPIRNDQVCLSCTPNQLSVATAEAARSLLALGTGRARGELNISTNPKSAELILDGAGVGTGRYQSSLPTGVYSVQAKQTGFLAQRTTVLVEQGKSASQQLTLLPKVPVFRMEPRPRARWRIVTGAAVAAVGVGLLSYGLSGLAIDGICAQQSPTGVCLYTFGSKATGVAFSAAGAALSLGGVLLIALPGGSRNVELGAGGFGDPVNE